MPSHTSASALIKLFFLDGAPWKWPAWQERTGIRHGLFSDNDEQLPPGWTHKDMVDVKSYFTAYNQISSEGEKILFASRTKGCSSYPGRTIWNAFVTRNYSKWGIHGLVIDELKEGDIHPMAILIRDNNAGDQWPIAEVYVPKILDSVGLKLFGYEAFPDNVEILTTEMRKCVQVFVQRSWNSLRSVVSNLEVGKLTKVKVTRTIRAVAKWKECAELFSTPDNVRKAEDMLAELHVIMEGLGAQITKSKSAVAKGMCKVSAKALRNLATEEDVTDLLQVYQEYLEMNFEEEDEPPLPDTSSVGRKLNEDGGDFGMEIEANLQLSNFIFQLGFPIGLPIQFNSLRHKSGTSPWDNPEPFEEDPIPDCLDNLNLHWHQLAGVHSIVRSLFTEHPDATHTTGVLIGDEVGLGKTAQAISLIAFLNQSILGSNRHIPRVLESRRFLGGSNKIPSLPHLILCPGTLVAQWVTELKILFLPKSVDIFVYDSRDGDHFWGPSSPLRHSKQKSHNCIIVASHSALFNDFKKTHPKQNGKNPRPWEIPQAKRPLANTIFGQSFLTVVVDEAHHMRNPGNKHLAALRLLQQAKVKLIMTATPLHTAPKDIASMGRLVGIPHFFDEASFIEEKADATRLRKAKKLDDDGEAALTEQLQIVRRLQAHCQGHFLRRTGKSVDNLGVALIPLPPYVVIPGVVNLSEREMVVMKERADAAKAAVLSSSSSRIQTKKFYLEYRTAVGYAKEDPSDPWPSFKTLNDWIPRKSTKMDVCARICAHYLERDDANDVTFVNGEPVFPAAPDIPDAEIKRTRRIIIYAEFPSMAPLLQNVLQLYGVPSLAINGGISFEQRDKRVKELYSNANTTRVLIFSSVGSAGLNLAIADVVVFFDQPWSAQDERQIRGRAHRQPQTKTVKVIHLLANNSADLLMNGVAQAKRNMFDAFVNKELDADLLMILRGSVPSVDDEETAGAEDGGDDTKAPPKKKKRRAKKIVVVDDEELPLGNEPTPPVAGSDVLAKAVLDASSHGSTSEPDMIPDTIPNTQLIPDAPSQSGGTGNGNGNSISSGIGSGDGVDDMLVYNENPCPPDRTEPELDDSSADPARVLDKMTLEEQEETFQHFARKAPLIQEGKRSRNDTRLKEIPGVTPEHSHSPGDRSPPSKRPRQGSASSARTGAPTPSLSATDPGQAGTPGATQSSTKPKPKPKPRPIPKPKPSGSCSVQPALAPKSSQTPANSGQAAHPVASASSAMPSHEPGLLDDVGMPPKTALKGIRQQRRRR